MLSFAYCYQMEIFCDKLCRKLWLRNPELQFKRKIETDTLNKINLMASLLILQTASLSTDTSCTRLIHGRTIVVQKALGELFEEREPRAPVVELASPETFDFVRSRFGVVNGAETFASCPTLGLIAF